MNLSFEGAQYDMSFMLADVETNEVLPGDELQLCPSESGPLPIFPMNTTRRRIMAAIQDQDKGAMLHLWISCAGLSRNARLKDSRCERCVGAVIFESIIGTWRNCASGVSSSPVMPPTSIVPSADRE